MPKYRKKPVEIEARIVHETTIDDIAHWSKGEVFNDRQNIMIETLEGNMSANIGDYVIKGVQGEFYPCKPDIFEQSYDQV